MAQIVNIGGETFKRRNIVAVWLGLPLITIGVYYYVWYYKVNNEARRYLRDMTIRPGISLLAVTLGWLLIVPPFVSIYNTGKRIRRMEEAAQMSSRVEPVLGIALAFIYGLHSLYYQSHLNGIWDRYLVGQAQPPQPIAPPPQAPMPLQSPQQFPASPAPPPPPPAAP